jgi:hypothetical protein
VLHRDADGDIYDGEWVDDMKNGNGKEMPVRARVLNKWESKTESWSSHAPVFIFVER